MKTMLSKLRIRLRQLEINKSHRFSLIKFMNYNNKHVIRAKLL